MKLKLKYVKLDRSKAAFRGGFLIPKNKRKGEEPMKFGDYELIYTPDECTEPRAQKSASTVETYTSMQFFNWGMILPGVKISLSWDVMSVDEFYVLDAIYAQNGTILWDSGIRGKCYGVFIASLDSVFINGTDGEYREKVTMTLYIVSEVI